MSIDDKAETKGMQICPTKITGVRLAKMYELIQLCRCDECPGYGLYLSRGNIVTCRHYDELCRSYYK